MDIREPEITREQILILKDERSAAWPPLAGQPPRRIRDYLRPTRPTCRVRAPVKTKRQLLQLDVDLKFLRHQFLALVLPGAHGQLQPQLVVS